ncbi:MAG: NfeD-like C-terminal, partner-binding [Acidobacteriota bacterium]|nr:NfeD-like C-terminal, partner-binding [Acidobacteriota bacterium]
MLPLIILIVALLLVAACVVVAAALHHKKGARVSLELIGRVATVERDLSPEGAVLVAGELMPARARGGETILRATCKRVRVVGARGHCLEVEPET